MPKYFSDLGQRCTVAETRGLPIEILQREGRYFTCSQPETCQQQQDRVVASTDGTLPIAAGQHSVDLLDRQAFWNRRDGPVCHARHASGEIRSDEVLIPRVSKERTQRTGHHFSSFSRSEERRVGKECRSRWSR